MGFSTLPTLSDSNSIRYDILSKVIEERDIIDYGFIPEFVGRVPIIAVLESLSKDALYDALTKPKNSLIKQYSSLFQSQNNVSWDSS